MSDARPSVRCPGCGASAAGPAEGGRCAACRSRLVRGATRLALAAAAAAAVLLVGVAALAGAFTSRFTIFWLALCGAAVFLVFKLARRVGYDLLADRMDAAPRADA